MKKITIEQLKNSKQKLAFYINKDMYDILCIMNIHSLTSWYGRTDQFLWYNNQGTYWSCTEPVSVWERVEISLEPVVNNTYNIL